MSRRHPRQKPREAKKATAEAPPATVVEEAASAAVPDKRPLAPTKEEKAAYQKRRAEDAVAEGMLSANRTIAWFTGASVLVSVVFGGVSLLQWQAAETSNELTRQSLEITRRASDAAAAQAAAATAQATAADKSLRFQYRSTVFIKDKLVFSPDPGKAGSARLEVENRGSLDATLEATWRVVIAREDGKGLSSEQQESVAPSHSKLGTVHSKDTVYAYLPIDAIDRNDWRAALANTKTIWILGEIVATNDAGAADTREFCWYSVPGTPYGWGACQSE